MTTTESTSGEILRVVLIVLGIFLLIPLVMMLVGMSMMGMMGWGGGMAGGPSPLWGIGLMVLPLVVLSGIGYLLYRGFVRDGGSSTADSQLEELRLAYARGDLSDDEFEERRAELTTEE